MNGFIACALFASLLVVGEAGKCDMMKEFKPEVDDISGWAKARCDKNPALSDEDLKKANSCFDQHLAPVLKQSKHYDCINNFMQNKIFKEPKIKNVCSDKGVQDKLKKDAMKDIGMKKGMECKKEVEGNCPPYKAAMAAFYTCVKG